MRLGKSVVQGSHASNAFLYTDHRNSPEAKAWRENGTTKICVKVGSEQELLDIYNEARKAGLQVHLVRDAGRTELEPGTMTCLAIGPHLEERIDPITKHLVLL